MGRRKIEIKAIKDDRNRSVTFLKRKGGLFKKAHELSVLCSVDVTVIIFGHNKKLYEYSSGDIQETLGRHQYYGPAHEHKGPADFAGKSNVDDEDEDDISPPPEDAAQPSHNTPAPPSAHQQAFQHVHHTPSVSPPIPNGVQYHPRNGTPQPSGVNSRPSSRNTIPAVSSNLAPPQHHHATPPPPPPPHQAQNGYPYMQNPSAYNPQANPNFQPPHPPRPGQYQYARPPVPVTQHQAQQTSMAPHHPQHQPIPPQIQQPPPHPHQHSHQHQNPHQHPQHPQQHPPPPNHPHHTYMQDQQRRQSMPPAFPQQERHGAQPVEHSLPQQQPEQRERPPSPSTLRPQPTKSRSIFTPIDDRGSVLAQHFGFAPPAESPKSESPVVKLDSDKTLKSGHPRPRQQFGAAAVPRSQPAPQRTHSSASISDAQRGSRTNSVGGAKRPQLKVTIPNEHSDVGEATGDSSRDSGNTAATPARGSDQGHSTVVLPPPSPSAGTLLSAGAQGPPNPFARPPPPGSVPQNGAYGTNGNNIETPISALPSRFVSDALLPSPSSFYPEWGMGRTGPDSTMLPSPLTFPTPVMQSGPGFVKDADEQERKRKSADNGQGITESVGTGKRVRVE